MFAQQITVSQESAHEGTCDKYDLLVDGTPLTRIGTFCDFRMPELIDGKVYTLEIQAKSNTSLNQYISTLDLVFMYQVILRLNDEPLAVYLGDLDQDGAVGTYDLIKLRELILAENTSDQAIYHVLKGNTEIPDLDFLDIQVNYSKLEFTSEDFISDRMEVKILKLGNLDNN